MAFYYPSGEVIRAGDRISFQDEQARVLFVKQTGEADDFAVDIEPSAWSFIPSNTIFLQFESGSAMGFDSFCDHDQIVLLSHGDAA